MIAVTSLPQLRRAEHDHEIVRPVASGQMARQLQISRHRNRIWLLSLLHVSPVVGGHPWRIIRNVVGLHAPPEKHRCIFWIKGSADRLAVCIWFCVLTNDDVSVSQPGRNHLFSAEPRSL